VVVANVRPILPHIVMSAGAVAMRPMAGPAWDRSTGFFRGRNL